MTLTTSPGRPARRLAARGLGTLGVVAALVGAPLAAPAGASTPAPTTSAASTYVVAVGGDASAGTHPVSTASTGTVALSARNSAGTVINYNCTRVEGSGEVATGVSVNPVGHLDTTTWTGCTMAGGALRILSADWSWVADGPVEAGVVSGRLEDVRLAVSAAANPDVCRFVVTGSMRATFEEATQQLRVAETGHTGNLTLSDVRGCLGRVQDGNPFDVGFTWSVTSPDGVISIS